MTELALDVSALTEIYDLPATDRDAVILDQRQNQDHDRQRHGSRAHPNAGIRAEKLALYPELTGALTPFHPQTERLDTYLKHSPHPCIRTRQRLYD